MKGMNIGLCAVTAGLLMAASSASAAPVLRDYTINATGNCNGALPSYEGALRKRPLAINNEGTATAFVSCSLPGDFFNEGNNYVAAGFENTSAAAVSVTCTFVDGFSPPFSTPQYIVKTVSVPAGGVNVLEWEPAAGAIFTPNANLNCSLPPGAGINLIEVQYEEDNGVADPAA